MRANRRAEPHTYNDKCMRYSESLLFNRYLITHWYQFLGVLPYLPGIVFYPAQRLFSSINAFSEHGTASRFSLGIYTADARIAATPAQLRQLVRLSAENVTITVRQKLSFPNAKREKFVSLNVSRKKTCMDRESLHTAMQ